jgi:hypothetical protein
MRAITGAVLSSKPCSLAKAARILDLFADSAASNLPSSDAATYLHTAADATKNHTASASTYSTTTTVGILPPPPTRRRGSVQRTITKQPLM